MTNWQKRTAKSVKPLLLMVLLISINSVHANDEHVKSDISLLQDIMEHMLIVISRVEDRQSRIAPEATYYFDTDRLRRDLHLISAGVDDYLSPSRQPARYVPLIEGDYISRPAR